MSERAANEDDWVTYVCTHCERYFDASHDSVSHGRPCGHCKVGTTIKLRELQALARRAQRIGIVT